MNILSRKRLESAIDALSYDDRERLSDPDIETFKAAIEFLLTPTVTDEMYKAGINASYDCDPNTSEVFKAMISKMTEDAE